MTGFLSPKLGIATVIKLLAFYLKSDNVSAISAAVTAVLTLGLLIVAILALSAARGSLEAAKAANEQKRIDSILQTRPYVFVNAVPSIAGPQCYDLVIANVGHSTARELQLKCSAWPTPNPEDYLTPKLKEIFETPRSLPPGCSLRLYWHIDTRPKKDSPFIGGADKCQITATYTSDDPKQFAYKDTFDIDLTVLHIHPVPRQ